MQDRMIIDSHCHITRIPEPVWGWGPHFYVEELIEQMDSGVEVLGERTHVSKALVMGSLGLTTLTEYSPLEQHEYLIDSLAKYPGRLFGNWVINPRHRLQESLDLVRKYVKEGTFRAMKLHPSMHNYWLPIDTPSEGTSARRMIYPVFELAQELDIPVMIHMGEPPYSVPATVWGVAAAFPQVNIIIAHTAVQGCVLTLDAINVARVHENVYLETSWAQIHLLIEATHTLGPDRIIYGSDCAPQDMKKEIRLCEVLTLRPPLGMNLSPDDLYKILGGNIARLCKIPTTEIETARVPVQGAVATPAE